MSKFDDASIPIGKKINTAIVVSYHFNYSERVKTQYSNGKRDQSMHLLSCLCTSRALGSRLYLGLIFREVFSIFSKPLVMVKRGCFW